LDEAEQAHDEKFNRDGDAALLRELYPGAPCTLATGLVLLNQLRTRFNVPRDGMRLLFTTVRALLPADNELPSYSTAIRLLTRNGKVCPRFIDLCPRGCTAFYDSVLAYPRHQHADLIRSLYTIDVILILSTIPT
jgi:hypothetical protein